MKWLPVAATFPVDLLPAMLGLAVGLGIALASATASALDGVGDDEQGAASGVLNTAIQIGAAAGIALLATTSTGATPLHPGDVVAGSVHVAGAAGAGLAGVGALLSWIAMRPVRVRPGAAGKSDAAAGMGT